MNSERAFSEPATLATGKVLDKVYFQPVAGKHRIQSREKMIGFKYQTKLLFSFFNREIIVCHELEFPILIVGSQRF
jgi:hypothetical protein